MAANDRPDGRAGVPAGLPARPGDVVSPDYRKAALEWALRLYDGRRPTPETVLKAARLFHAYVYGA
jgi:hypothetical protein